jgi:hypothetical protein
MPTKPKEDNGLFKGKPEDYADVVKREDEERIKKQGKKK